MIRRSIGVLTCVLLPLWGSYAQQKQPPKNPPPAPQAQEDPCKKPLDQGKIDEAIKKGCRYLLDNINKAYGDYLEKPLSAELQRVRGDVPAELVLLTLIHGGAFSEKDEKCKKLLESVLSWEPTFTYRSVLKAMALKELDKGKYVEFLAQIGQFLVDTQSSDGRWTYGLHNNGVATGAMGGERPKIRASSSGDKTGAGIQLKKKSRNLINDGDNSNTQYAALGLRAVHDAGIEIPRETLELAKQWWEKSQYPDGGWAYTGTGGGVKKGTTNEKPGRVPPRGVGGSTAPMTGGGTSSMAIYLYLLGEAKKKEDFAKNDSIAGGIQWMSKDFEATLKSNPQTYWANLYLTYSVERAGIMAEFTKLGEHDWYKEGVHWLLASQNANGSWNGKMFPGQKIATTTVDTCFAILFLKRATEPLIDTGPKEKFIDNSIDSGKPEKK